MPVNKEAILQKEKSYQVAKNLILKAINKSITEQEHRELLKILTPIMLVYKPLSNEPHLLYWTLIAAIKNVPQLFIHIWFLHHDQFTIADFRRHRDTLKQYASTHWLLAFICGTYPTLYLQFLERFNHVLTMDDFNEVMTDASTPESNCTIFTLLAHNATKNPAPFMRFWPSFSSVIKAKMLSDQSQTIAGQQVTPFESLCTATKTGMLDCSVIHFCYQQLGDLRPCQLSYFPLEGDIVKKVGKHVVLYNIKRLLNLKNHFFDVLARRINNECNDLEVQAAAYHATLAGFHNAYFFLALVYKNFNQEAKAYDVLSRLPVHSMYHDIGLSNSINWYLRQATAPLPKAQLHENYRLLFQLALKITDTSKQTIVIQVIAYHFMHDGKSLPSGATGPLSATQIAALQDNHDVDRLMVLLKTRKAAKIFHDICDDIVRLPLIPALPFLPTFESLYHDDSMAAAQEKSSDNSENVRPKPQQPNIF